MGLGTPTTEAFTRRSSQCCNLLLLITILLGADARLEVLKDGLLVTGNQTIKTVATEYTLVVLIDEPQYPSFLRDDVVKLTASLKRAASLGKVNKPDLGGWLLRIRRLKSLKVPGGQSRVSLRTRRGFFNFVGDISHTLFGTATDSSVEAIKKIVSKTLVKQGQVVHQVNDLMSIVNHTYDEIQANRDRLNDLTGFVNKTVTSLNEWIRVSENKEDKLNRFEFTFNVEKTLQLMERGYQEYRTLHHRYMIQRSSLEDGRLNEFLLTQEQLVNVLRQETKQGVVPIKPLQWYQGRIQDSRRGGSI